MIETEVKGYGFTYEGEGLTMVWQGGDGRYSTEYNGGYSASISPDPFESGKVIWKSTFDGRRFYGGVAETLDEAAAQAAKVYRQVKR